ncbi:MAG TPA: hypothetical protein VFM82_10095 [Flavobacteriaceae bacterium]|nr:hypothetical protein [Flavobacteriaceae bacterium]
MKKTLLLSVFLFTIFSHAQTANPAWLTVCEEDTDGFALFDPSAADSQVLDTQNPEDFSISYHSTVSDAQNNVNAVYYPFTNWIAYNQTLYSRLEDFATGNFDTSTLELIVGESFEVEQNIPPLVACDDDNDGIVLFDLTLNNDLILGDLDPTVHSFTYYTTPTDAENGIWSC